jgi:8-oxo-dGTP diphosphatase
MTKTLPQRAYISVHLLLTQDDKIFLLRRLVSGNLYNHFAPIAGCVDKHENLKTAMVREALEEAGINIKEEDITLALTIHRVKTFYNNDYHDGFEFYFKTEIFVGTPKICEPEKATDIGFYSLNNLPQPISPFLLTALNAIKNNIPFLTIDGNK